MQVIVHIAIVGTIKEKLILNTAVTAQGHNKGWLKVKITIKVNGQISDNFESTVASPCCLPQK
jgi:uncharacterized membrane protein